MELLLKENSDLPLKNVNNFYVIDAGMFIFGLDLMVTESHASFNVPGDLERIELPPQRF
jgi:hypothetical protein